MNIKQFSEKTGLTPRAIRFYEEKGILKANRDSNNHYRTYTQEHIVVAKKIDQFRQLGFAVNEIAVMLKSSPSLSIESVNKNIKANLKKLHQEKEATEKKIRQTEALLDATVGEESLSSRQKEMFQSMAYTSLHDWSLKYVDTSLKRKSIGPVEQLQMVACAYADLILRATMRAPYKEFAESHRLIAKTLSKIKEPRLAGRHEELAQAYDNLHKDPTYYDLPV
jgi:DNA-binding transcriptional MerR regulator